MGVTKQQLFNTVQRIKAYVDSVAVGGNSSNFLAKDNTEEYTPTQDYHPATKQYVDNAKVNISQKIDNAIKQEHDGLYVPSVAKTSISTEEDNALVEKEDGLYVPSIAETNISTEENNAVVKKDDGIFVEDKTNTIQAISDKVDSINKYQKYINTELDYCYLNLEQLTEKLTLSVGTVIPFVPANCKNMKFDLENHSVTLNAGKTYKISADIRIQNGDAIFYVKDTVTSKGLRNFVKSTAKNQGITDVNFVYTPQSDCKIQICCAYIYDGNTPYLPEGAATQDYGYFIVEEIGRQTVIDPIEHVNSESGVEDTPVGHIISHMGKTAPAHYLICDGAEYKIIDYPYLVQHFIDEFGSSNYFGGDGITTFAVPDLRGEFLRGTGTATRGTGTGNEVGKHQDGTDIPILYITSSGNVTFRKDSGNVNADNSYTINNKDAVVPMKGVISGTHLEGTNITSSLTYASYTMRPTNTAVLYCIKYEPTYCVKVENKIDIEQIAKESEIVDSPVGHVISHMGNNAPAHYLICDGAEYNIVDYQHLANHFANEFGSANYFGGDGVTTFAVPDLRGEFLRGSGKSTIRDVGAGSNVGTHQDPTWMHAFYKNGQTDNLCYYGDDSNGMINRDATYNAETNSKATTTSGRSLKFSKYTAAASYPYYASRPTNTSVLFCIKYEPTYCMQIESNNSSENTELTDEEIEELVNKAYNEAIQEIEGVSS